MSTAILEVGSGPAIGGVRVSASRQVQPLVQEMLAIKLGQIRKQIFRPPEVLMDIAVD